MDEAARFGAIINVLSSRHPHFRSLLEEGLWGFRDDVKGINRSRWGRLADGCPVLIYLEHRGVRGIWLTGVVVEKFYNRRPVAYWVQNPTGFPLQVRLEFTIPRRLAPSPSNHFKIEWLDGVKPLRRDELASLYGIRAFKAYQDRWSLFVFGEKKLRGVTYSYPKFKVIMDEFEARNRLEKAPPRLDHNAVKELIYRIGQIQGKNPEKEYPLEDKRIDVVWRRVPKGVPSVVFEVSIRGDLYADLVKLKHAHDIWNSIAVLVTTSDKVREAETWIRGTFHEAKDYFRIITVNKIKEYYEAKRKVKEIENLLKLP